MKKLLFSLTCLSIVAASIDGCKKGDGDPFLSLRSRTSRMAGVWTVGSGTGTKTNSSGTVTTETYDGTTLTSTSGSNATIKTISYKYTFEKDGKYKSETTSTEKIATISYTKVESESGTWNFTGGVGEIKNKSQLFMQTLTSTTTTTPGGTTFVTYTGFDGPQMLYDLYELKNKEVVVKQKGTESNPSSSFESSWTWKQ